MTVVSANDQLVDLFNERAIDLLRVEAGTRAKVFRLLASLEKELVKSLAKIDPTGSAQDKAQQRRLTKLLAEVRAAIRGSYRGINTLMTRELRNLVDIEASWLKGSVNKAIGFDFLDSSVTRTFVETVVSDILVQGAPTKEWWARQAGGLVDRFADQMRIGMAAGEPLAELVKRVRGGDGATGLMDASRTSAERLVRSSVQTAANAARQATYNENADLISALRWHSTLDNRTSTPCIVRDGLQYTLEDHKPIGHKVPWLQGPGALHWCCRSTSVPLLVSWRDLGIDEDEVPETTRASMDGQVPASTTYEEWLRKQPKSRQDDVLGEGKADLWRRGKIDFRDLLDQSGRPLTTEELRAKAR